jgi:hypothetical protein
MKAYVLYYGPDPTFEKEEETAEEREARLLRPPIVQYGSYPGWTLPERHLAEIALLEVNRMGVSVNEHWCEFAVDDLPEGGFAIYCTNHPKHLGLIPSP